VVFSSLFGKKDKDGKERAEDKREGVKTAPAPGASSARQPVTAGASAAPAKAVSAESKAAATAAATAKIDAIEKEMALEFTVSNASGNKPRFEKSADFRAGGAPPAAAPAYEEDDPALTGTFGDLGTATDLLGGNFGAHALEINASELAPTIEEVAVLYANGQASAAAQVLVAAIQEDQLGASALMAWQMLFELFQQLDKRTDFEDLAIAYAARFETSPPAFEGAGTPAAAPKPRLAGAAGSGTVFAFAGTVDGGIAPQLEKLRKAAEKQKLLRIDFNKVVKVAPDGAELLLGVLNGLRKTKHEVVFTGTEHMADVLRGEVEVGRRDPTDHAWMLLLEMYRIMGKQHEFEELSIDYCVTYEVSPPSWEAVKNMRAEAGAVATPAAEVDVEAGPGPEAAEDGQLVFAGEIEGKAEAALAALAKHAAERGRIEIDCAGLKRVDFAAAGHLLNTLFGLSAKGKQVIFRRVNHLVAALFCVMGIQEVATIERRKL
jgi:ABC-type transporter Mla MlaB component